MRVRLVFLFTLVMGAIPLAAQYTGSSPAQKSFGVACITTMDAPCPVSPPRCPVSMRAQHLSDGSMVKTGKAVHPAGIGQRLHLTIANPDAKQITGARLTIHGVTPKGRVIKASSAKEDSPEATREVSVSFSAGQDRSATADLWVPGMTAVESIDVDSVAYSDGSTWKVADGNACRITPDPLMLITSR